MGSCTLALVARAFPLDIADVAACSCSTADAGAAVVVVAAAILFVVAVVVLLILVLLLLLSLCVSSPVSLIGIDAVVVHVLQPNYWLLTTKLNIQSSSYDRWHHGHQSTALSVVTTTSSAAAWQPMSPRNLSTQAQT